MLVIKAVTASSLADFVGIEPGDRLLQINNQEIRDSVDYYRALHGDHLCLDLLRGDEVVRLEITKLDDEDIGLEIEQAPPQQCGNNCVFCFVHQLPKGLRRSLYIKDEDYRYSYLFGSFITLTNLDQGDFDRIIRDRLSPLYISVHATDTTVRNQLLGASAPPLMPLLRRLTDAGIVLHCQIVLCPGINDARILEQTIQDLAALYPQVTSIAVVPVGLTRFRQRLPALAAVSGAAAEDCLNLVSRFQQVFFKAHGTRLLYAADELYQSAGRAVPPVDEYEDLPQFENGVGMLACFQDQAEDVLQEAEPLELEEAVLVTGRSFSRPLEDFAVHLSRATGVRLEVITVMNDFFGPGVTVAGLITGTDLLLQLQPGIKGRPLLIPDVMLKADQPIFLDDMTVTELAVGLGVRVEIIESSAWGILDGLERLADGPIDVVRC